MPAPTEVTAPTDRTIRVVRTFDAPVDLVWDAFTKPELLQRWMGVFGDWQWESCDVDLREGGSWRYAWKQAQGEGRLVLAGVYREVVPQQRIVMTQRYEMEGLPGFGEMLVTTTFTQTNGQTTLDETIEYETAEARDMDLQNMPTGLEPGFALLDDILASMQR